MAVVNELDQEQRKYRKADHDRQRYARRIRFLQAQQGVLSREYNALRAERDMLKAMLDTCEKSMQHLQDKIGGCCDEDL